jgi:precorrin-6Y C5,15-methyltransferase (decarboxylating)
MDKWLAVIGIGEDGLSGLSPIAHTLIAQSTLLVGGKRHLALVPTPHQRTLIWSSPIAATITEILRHRGQPVCVLASGDPLHYGVGVTLLRQIPIAEMIMIPAPSAFSLACARLGWAVTDTEQISLCGRDPALLHSVLYPGAQVLILSADHTTPAIVAQHLTQQGFGESQMTVLERLGSPHERQITGIAATWDATDLAELNLLAIACTTQPAATAYSRLAGLPDTAYHHDGQLTKREVRAVTLAALAPMPGQLLWDVGAGCGSIGIEWMRTHPRCRAIAIEPRPDRQRLIADNATALGTPSLQIVPDAAPIGLAHLPAPDAIFIGGGVTTPDVIATCWQALRPDGRLVANAVTIESEQILYQWQSQVGGGLSRLAVHRAEPLGNFLSWKALAPVTQWVVVKRREKESGG